MPAESYDAFLSYRSTARVQARRVKAALEGLAQPKRGDEPFRVFLDESSLLVGDLSEEIETALKGSHALTVLLARDTVESKWVNREIEFWLDNGGTVDHLFIVRLDDVDLSWDEERNDWAEPAQVPAALHGLFAREQKYIDLGAMSRGVERTAVAPVFAAVRDRTIESLLLDEAARARRRQRTVTLIAASIGVLLVVAVGAGVWALISRSQADAATREALGQADAAQAVLSGQTDPVQAAQFALQAAQHSDSLTVRAAMLSAAANSRDLVHSMDVPAGSSADDASFSPDGSRMGVVIQPMNGSDARFEIRSVATAKVVASGTLPPATAWVRLLSTTKAVLCSNRTGTHLVTVRGSSLSLSNVDAQPDAGPPPKSAHGMPDSYSTCDEPTPTSDGLLVSTVNGNNHGEAERLVLVRDDGQVATLTRSDDDDLSVEKVARDGHHALVLGGSGARIVDTTLATSAAVGGVSIGRGDLTITDTDSEGEFFGQIDDHEWLFIRSSGSAYETTYSASTMNEGDTIWAAAPLVDSEDHFTGAVATLDHGSVLAVPGTGQQQGLGDDRSANHAGTQSWNQYRPELRRMDDSRYLAVFGSSAFVVDLEPSYPLADGWEQGEHWAVAPVGQSLNGASRQGEEPVAETCGGDVLLAASPTGFEDPAYANGGKLLVDADGTYRLLPDSTTFGGSDCAAIESSPAVALRSTDASKDTVFLPSVDANAQVVAGGGSRVVVLRGSAPIEIFQASSGSPAWSMAYGDGPRTVATNGTNSIRQTEKGFRFVTGGGTKDVHFDDPGDVLAVSPDATALVAADKSLTPKLITRAGVADLTRCVKRGGAAEGRFEWLPGAGYATSHSAAATATLVRIPYSADGESRSNAAVDCATGKKRSGGLAGGSAQLTRYQTDKDGGVIETLTQPIGASGVTTGTHVGWTGGDPVVRTYSTRDKVSSIVWSQDGDVLVATSGATKTVLRWSGGEWKQQVALSYPGTARFSPDGLLVITDMTEAASGLWVIDPTTGHVVLSDDLGDTDYLQDNSLPITVVHGRMVVPMWQKSDKAGSSLSDAPLTIPIGLKVLRQVLCGVNRIAICAGVSSATSTATPSAASVTPTRTADAVAWPAQLSGRWCLKSDPGNCFSRTKTLKNHPGAVIMSSRPSTEAPGATDYVLCLQLDLGDSCTTASSMYLRYFPAKVPWNCTASEVTGQGWPACSPDFTSAHDTSKPRLVILLNHQQGTTYSDTEPMYRVSG